MNPIRSIFNDLRFDETSHLGLGDIRLTIGQQDVILADIDSALAEKDEQIATLKNVILSDERQIKNLVKRNKEMRDDLIKTARDRDIAQQQIVDLTVDRDRWRDMCEDCNCIKIKERVVGELVEKNKTLTARIKELEAEANPEREQPESSCRELDGCPTEGAVLRREWRRLTARIKTGRRTDCSNQEEYQITTEVKP